MYYAQGATPLTSFYLPVNDEPDDREDSKEEDA